jgi:hypothetical protein
MFLKNYTSDVPVSQTIHSIEDVLIKCGVSGIMKEYGSTAGDIKAITFQIKLDGINAVTVRLPVNVQRAQDALFQNYAKGEKLTPDGRKIEDHRTLKKKKWSEFRDQAERTAWRITFDWVQVQMSMIEMKQADFREVFLPYVWDGRTTFYQRVHDGGFRALIPEKASE